MSFLKKTIKIDKVRQNKQSLVCLDKVHQNKQILVCLDKTKQIVMPPLLQEPIILDWVYGRGIYKQLSGTNKATEIPWGNKINQTHFGQLGNTVQWTTRIGEGIVKTILQALGHNVWRPKGRLCPVSGHNVCPDLETEDAVYEVKSRNYSTTGTAGQKILGTPLHYSEVPKIFGKPLRIVLVGYQEMEAIEDFCLFDVPDGSNRKRILEFFKNELQISYLKCSDLLEELEAKSK